MSGRVRGILIPPHPVFSLFFLSAHTHSSACHRHFTQEGRGDNNNARLTQFPKFPFGHFRKYSLFFLGNKLAELRRNKDSIAIVIFSVDILRHFRTPGTAPSSSPQNVSHKIKSLTRSPPSFEVDGSSNHRHNHFPPPSLLACINT